LEAGSSDMNRYLFNNKCEFGSSWCGSHIWFYGINNGTKTWKLEVIFDKFENLKMCKKYRSKDNVLTFEIPPNKEAVAFAKRINSQEVVFNWAFKQSWI